MIVVKNIINKEVWEKFILQRQDGNFLQSWEWGELNDSLGHKIFRIGFLENEKLVGLTLLIKKISRRGIYLECAGGPLIDWTWKSSFPAFLKEVIKIAKSEKCDFIRIRPQLLHSPENLYLFKEHKFVPSPMHLHAETTWQLDLSLSEDNLFRNMRKTTRYLIRKAIKDKVEIIRSQDLRDVEELYKLQLETAKRHKFVAFSKKFFLAEFKAFDKDRNIEIFKATYNNEILSIAFILFYNNQAIYHYSGSSSKYLKIPSSYLLQWEVIKYAKKRNCRIYNFWGIAPNDNPKHRFAGVTTFKKGFGGYEVSYLHAQDLPLTVKYWPIHLFEQLRKRSRHL